MHFVIVKTYHKTTHYLLYRSKKDILIDANNEIFIFIILYSFIHDEHYTSVKRCNRK